MGTLGGHRGSYIGGLRRVWGPWGLRGSIIYRDWHWDVYGSPWGSKGVIRGLLREVWKCMWTHGGHRRLFINDS